MCICEVLRALATKEHVRLIRSILRSFMGNFASVIGENAEPKDYLGIETVGNTGCYG